MATSELERDYLSARAIRFPGTSGSQPQQSLASQTTVERDQAGWQEFIDGELHDWASGMPDYEAEGLRGPSLLVLNLAREIATRFRDSGALPPTRISPNGEGGIVFERLEGPALILLEIQENLSFVSSLFVNGRLVERETDGLQ